MKKSIILFRLNVLMFTVFVAVVLTGTTLDIFNKPDSAILGLHRADWVQIHVVAALTLITAVLCHLALHWDWIKAAFYRAGKSKPRQIRRNRAINVAMFLTGVCVAQSGVMTWILSGNVEAVRSLTTVSEWQNWTQWHHLGTKLLIVLVVVHLVVHRDWIVLSISAKNRLEGTDTRQ